MGDRFETLRWALGQADKHNRDTLLVQRSELGSLVDDHDRMVDAIKAGGFPDLAAVRRGAARTAGWVPLDEVTAALRDEAADMRENGHDASAATVEGVADYLAERFGQGSDGAGETKEGTRGDL